MRLYEFYSDDFYYYLITEYCEGGDLLNLLSDQGDISEKEAALIIEQLLAAIEYCHKRNVVHRYPCF